ncbi:MAG TPA: DUF6152 family protein [Steroidobacteraceae bacterium]
MIRRAVLLGIAGSMVVGPALAHHSITMFDAARMVTLSGTVKLFQWTNPHSFIQLLVPSETGTIEWSVEMGSPGSLYRGGWRPGTLKPGDKIKVVIHPNRDGTAGGLLKAAVAADGRRLGSQK